MKNFSSLVLTLLFVVASTTAQATITEPLPIKDVKIVTAKEQQKINVFFNQFKAEEVTIKVKDLNGYVLFTERVKGTLKYAKTYDLTNLPSGKYQLVLSDNIKEYIQIISIANSGVVTVESTAANVVYNPTVLVKDKHLDLNILLAIEDDIKVSILNEDGEELFTETNADTFKIEKRYNLQDLESGDYTLKLKTKYKTIYKNFSL